jgi:2-polyprenyl-3-methyl-5-hydroxy-6-metoxy-1,4-benzoquinol methylase
MKRETERLSYITFIFFIFALSLSWHIRPQEYEKNSIKKYGLKEESAHQRTEISINTKTKEIFTQYQLPFYISELNHKIISQLFVPVDTHYDKNYWEFQKPMGEMGGVLEQWKFRKYIPPGANCLDFGGGGGFLLDGLSKHCSGKMGIELNPHAAAHAWDAFKITLFNSTEFVPDQWADVIISNHALEHVFCPWCELSKLLPKLKKKSGKIIFVVPAAGRNDHWTGTPDVNFHLHTWSPQTLGNLMSAAGYSNVQVDILAHQWPDDALNIYKNEGENAFIEKGRNKNLISPYGGCEYQLRVVASVL